MSPAPTTRRTGTSSSHKTWGTIWHSPGGWWWSTRVTDRSRLWTEPCDPCSCSTHSARRGAGTGRPGCTVKTEIHTRSLVTPVRSRDPLRPLGSTGPPVLIPTSDWGPEGVGASTTRWTSSSTARRTHSSAGVGSTTSCSIDTSCWTTTGRGSDGLWTT